MKYIVLVLFLSGVISSAFAQNWVTSAPNIYYNSGNVGIGTATPNGLLHLSSANSIDLFMISSAQGGYSRLFFGAGTNGARWNVGQRDDIGGIFSIESDATGAGAWGSRFALSLTGNVGIGTTTPGAILDVGALLSPGTLGTVLARLPEGNTTGAGTYLGIKGYYTQLNGNITNANDVVSFSIEHSFYGVTNSSINFLRGGGTSGGSISFNTNDNSEMMRLLYNGNLLIGKTSQTNAAYKLDVAGSVRANQIVVNTTGADFVFEPTYQLLPLSMLKKYLNQNHHLPGIPSAKQMQADGLNVGENQVKLLQKVEELTLYLIQQKEELEKQNKQQQEKISSQEERISKLEQSLDRLLKDK